MAVYTLGDWHVKQGREKEFVDYWHEVAQWSTEQFPGGWGKLLRDKDEPTHFYSVGEWSDDAQIGRWRASDGFQERMDGMSRYVDEWGFRTLDLATEVGRVPAHA